MKQKMIFFDLETTGLDPKKSAIHQLAGKVIIDGKEVESFNIKLRPFENAVFEDAALETVKLTKEEIMAYPDYKEGYEKFLSIVEKYVNKYDKKDKFFLAGYNIATFDIPFLRNFFLLNNNQYFGAYFWSVPIDVIILAQAYLMNYRSDMKDFKQGTVAAQLGIALKEENLHDALYDIEICHEIYKIVTKKTV